MASAGDRGSWSWPSRLTLSSLAILIFRVTALYDRAKWVTRGLWILAGLLYAVTIILSGFAIGSFRGEFIPAEIREVLSPTNPQINLCTILWPKCAFQSTCPSKPMHPLPCP